MRAMRIHAYGGPEVMRLERLLALKLRVPVQARFPLEQASAAYELSRNGHPRGKIILRVG
jgi:NADPH:quinone reductase-like Zn-dependent oxidoreductase